MSSQGTPIDIVQYRPEWPGQFRQIAAPIRDALGDRALRIDHIGSTAVPGLPAKDVIDVQATVAGLEPREPIADALTRLGFTWLDTIAYDHIPPGSNIPPESMQKLFFSQRGEKPRVNLHVRVAGNPNQRYPLLFRDYLRTHLLATAAYAEVKRQLSRYGSTDWDHYYDIKDPVCDIIMAAAEEWAQLTVWTQGVSDA
jgi:GrpB-like predicted nucleotidyltransferase (UPF0157 family)